MGHAEALAANSDGKIGKPLFAGEPAPTRSTCTGRYRDAGLLVVGASLLVPAVWVLVPAVWVLADPVVGKASVRGQGRSYRQYPRRKFKHL